MLATLACLMLVSGYVHAQEFVVRSFPIPINVEGEHVRSGAFLQFEMKTYGMAFGKFAAMKLDPREAVFVELVKGIQHNDPTAVEKVLRPARPRKVNPNGKNGVVSAPPLTPAQSAIETTQVYRAAFGNLENLDVIAQVLVGSKSLFIWDAKMPGRPRRRAFAVESEGQPARLVAREVIGSPVDTLILSIFEDGVKDPAAYAAVADPHLHYRQPLAIEGKNKIQHEVALLFNGEPMDFDAFGETPVNNPLLAFYRKVFTAFKAHKQDEFLAGHSSKSQAKLRQWWKTMTPEAADAYYATTVHGRIVKFVLNADPIYILFYGDSKGRDWGANSLGYQYVLYDHATEHYLIVNVLNQGFFDEVIGNPEMFDQGMLKPPTVSKKPADSK